MKSHEQNTKINCSMSLSEKNMWSQFLSAWLKCVSREVSGDSVIDSVRQCQHSQLKSGCFFLSLVVEVESSKAGWHFHLQRSLRTLSLKSIHHIPNMTSNMREKWNLLSCSHLLKFSQFLNIQMLVLETQWPQHVAHAPTPWTSSAKLQAHFLLYTQTAVLKHTFFKSLHTILCIWHNFHVENLLFSQGTHCHSR